MTIKIQQGNLFGSSDTNSKKSIVNAPSSQSTYKQPPDVSLAAGLNKMTLENDGVYLLRVLAGQYMRGLPAQPAKKKLLDVLLTEIKFKKGLSTPNILLKDCLLKRNI